MGAAASASIKSTEHGDPNQDELLADLTVTAYQVALKHGIKGNFLECELEMHRALRQVLQKVLKKQLSKKSRRKNNG